MAGQPRTMPGVAAGGRARPRLLPPLWRAAPRRLLREPLTLVLMTAVLALVAVASAAGPLHAEAVSDASLHLVLDAVPEGSAAQVAPVVRLNGGLDPAAAEASSLTEELADVPGLGAPRVTLQSVSTELHPKIYFDPVGPVVAHGSATAPVRLLGVEDPASRVVAVSRSGATAAGIWLPQPVAQDLGVAAGDEVTLSLSGVPEPPTARVTVGGVYAVEDDERTPRSPSGERLWRDLAAEGFPSDALEGVTRARLAVADLGTAASLADRIGDDVLWSVLAHLSTARPRLADLDTTAEAVRALRLRLAGEAGEGPIPPALRPGVATGVVDLDEKAHELAGAARQGATVTTRVGIALALALVVAAAGWSVSRRRREVRLVVASGRRPAFAGLLAVVELLPAAVVGGTVGWLLARALVAAAVGTATPSTGTVVASVLWCVGGVLAALLTAGAVAAVATRAETRRLEGRADVRVPWVLALTVLATAAAVGLLTRPPDAGEALGPLDVLVPPLVIAALAALGARGVFALVRRTAPAVRPPTRRTVGAWLARRRLRAPDPGREVAVTIAATGLAMLVLSLAALSSTERTVDDRAAARAGAVVVHRVGESWRLDPTVARQAAPPDDGTPLPTEAVPVARTPVLPAGQSVAWRTRTTVATSDESVQVLAVDPTRFAASASWGADEGSLAEGRALLPELARADARSAEASRRDGVGAPVPALLVGEVGDLGLGVDDTVAVDTLNLTVRMTVTHVLPAFPGALPGTLVVPADALFATQGNEDPRLRPGVRTPRNRPLEFQAELWSSSEAAAAATLRANDRPLDVIRTLAAARVLPAYVAAEQARRYQVALGSVFGALGAAAVVLAAVRLARRSPAADRMIAWSGAGRRAPSRARVAETAVVLVLATALGAAALAALRPAAGLLLEPGDAIAPPATLVVPGSALLAGGLWLVVTGVVSALGMRLAASSRSTVEVLRGED